MAALSSRAGSLLQQTFRRHLFIRHFRNGPPRHHPKCHTTWPTITSVPARCSGVNICGVANGDGAVLSAEGRVPTGSINTIRCYAKGKREKISKKSKSKHDKHSVKVSVEDEEMNQVIDYDKMKEQMEQTIQHLKLEYIEQVTLRTSIGVYDQLMIETKDGKFPLIQLGQIAQKTAQLIAINMAATPQYIPEVKKALVDSGLCLNPQQDSTSLFIPIPKVTREHRENLAAAAKTLCMKAKEKIRHTQNKFGKDAKKEKDSHSQDLIHDVQEMILAKGHEYGEQAEQLLKLKQKELLGDK